MPSCPRREIVREGEVGVYHCWHRCVRQARLCGEDQVSGKNYDHRRDWIVQFEQQLVRNTAVEVAGHAELPNHLHVILRSRPDVVGQWDDQEVARRWLTVTHLIRSHDGKTIKPITEQQIAAELAQAGRVQELRGRLSSISTFMGALAEHVARRSNAEDGCKGRFWESRFECRELVDEPGILLCAIYVDLNPIRAGEALTPETSRHASVFERIQGFRQRQAAARGQGKRGDGKLVPGKPVHASCEPSPDGWLCELTLQPDQVGRVCASFGPDGARPSRRPSDRGLLSITLAEYLTLLDQAGRIVKAGKPGAIPADLAPILERLDVKPAAWSGLVLHFDKWFGHAVGTAERVKEKAAAIGRSWFRGQRRCAEAFG